ncbi:MAG: type II secretion system protein GspM [Mariprofundus sp.]
MSANMNDLLGSARTMFEEKVLPQYVQLEERDQRIVLAAVVLIPLLLLIFGIMLPLHDRQLALKGELKTMQSAAVEAERLADYLTKHAAGIKAGGGKSTTLLSTVDQLARQAKVRSHMTRIKPQMQGKQGQQRLLVQMKDAPYSATLRFIHALAAKGLGSNSLKLQASKTAGHVHVRLMISG